MNARTLVDKKRVDMVARGHTEAREDAMVKNELLALAVSYANPANIRQLSPDGLVMDANDVAMEKARIGQLTCAAAFIHGEIDRRLRVIEARGQVAALQAVGGV